MKAYLARSLLGPDSLAIEDVPAPGPLSAGQIRIAMRAASINPRDLMVLSGDLRATTLPDLIPGTDGAGEVVEIGAEVTRVKPGDRVALTLYPDWIAGPLVPGLRLLSRGLSIHGTMCEQLVVSQQEAVLLPPHLSFEEGAALPCAGVTAWNALCGSSPPLLPGMSVLVQGGGGVSVFALQFAKLFGARVLAISSSPERCARLKSLGADEVIDYQAQPDWGAEVLRLTDGVGVDLAVEVGGASTTEQAMASTRLGGRLARVGLLSGWPSSGGSMAALRVDITPVRVGSRQDFEAMNRAIAFHRLRPLIDSRFRFEQLAEALRRLQTRRHMGKIVIGFD